MCCFKLLKNNKTNILFVNQFILVRGRYLILEYFTCSLIFKDAHRLPVPQASTPFPATGCLLSLQHFVCGAPSQLCVSYYPSGFNSNFTSSQRLSLPLTLPHHPICPFKAFITVGMYFIDLFVTHIWSSCPWEPRQGLGSSHIPPCLQYLALSLAYHGLSISFI